MSDQIDQLFNQSYNKLIQLKNNSYFHENITIRKPNNKTIVITFTCDKDNKFKKSFYDMEMNRILYESEMYKYLINDGHDSALINENNSFETSWYYRKSDDIWQSFDDEKEKFIQKMKVWIENNKDDQNEIHSTYLDNLMDKY